MAQKIYLSTYKLSVFEEKAEVLLSKFNANEDFFDFFNDFMTDIYTNIKKTHSFKDRTVLHLTLDEPVTSDKSKRVFYGYISSGIGGDKFKVRAEGETTTAFEADPNKHVTFRNLFFYLQLPRDKNYGYLIIQKKRDLGAKGLIEKALNLYLKERGYLKYSATINNLLNGRVFDRMMTEGSLKNIDFIRKTIPSTIEDLYSKGLKKERGTLTTSVRAPSLGKYWKDLVKELYHKNYKKDSLIELEGLDKLDEVEFELELNGKKKTFHVFAKSRTQPDVEISDDLDIVNNEPTVESLVRVSESLITDMLTLKPNVSAH
ncbi:hypothetical protein CPT03_03200 [Pedobacter ginsengisoli]|uniref:Uncharacterized protein n=1 Tax=Pedobacter ginsengisoli TaxID=363852 RepID=A0A2D1U1P5_9SPHI|nr:hypothetical protein [Pedobacter ginsengisoli]ATP55537.1 hypothetical protein CPT03_03200 [Pedobacter ginsengisoli]